MKKIKDWFATPKKAVRTIAIIVVIVLVVGAISVWTVRTVAESTSIGSENALNFAYAHAGVDPADATVIKERFEFDDGHFVYDIEFVANGVKYEYTIKASDGTVLKSEYETVSNTTTTTDASISLDVAKSTALSDAGVNESDVTYTKNELDYDDGVLVYDIEFYTSGYKYEYEINATTGEVYSKSSEALNTTSTSSTNSSSSNNSSNSGSSSSSSSSTTITLEKAKSIALSDAGLNSSDVTFTKTAQDYDDGVLVYDIEFYTSTTEYEYEINATTGVIKDKSVETFSGTTTSTSTSYIGVDKAKEIAVNQAGLSVSEVTFSKTKLESDDGIMVYEVEFYKDGIEYECTINAVSGSVIEYDYERY